MAKFKHGLSQSAVYEVWHGMHQRCEQPSYHSFPRYGGRGITVCERWASIENFIADMGEPPPGMSLDRIDNSGPYSPENCRWATRSQQQRNKRDNRSITFNGETLLVVEWAERLNLPYYRILHRLNAGRPIEDVLSTTPLPRRSGRDPLTGKFSAEIEA